MGPFEHKSSRQKHPPQTALNFIYSDAKTFMPDISEFEDVKHILRNHSKAVFGWSSQDKMKRMIKDEQALYRLGFRLVIYDADPLYVGNCGQVLFVR